MKPLMTKKTLRHSFEWRTTLIIVLVLIAVLLTSFFLLYRNTIRLANETKQLHQNQLENIVNSFHNLYYNFYFISETLSVNNNLRTIASFSESVASTRFIQEGASLQKILMSFSAINSPCVNMIAVYFPKSDSVVTMSRNINSDEIYLFFKDYPEVSPERLQQLAFTDYRNSYQTMIERHNWIIRKVKINENDAAYIMIEYNLDDLISHCTMGVSNALVIVGTEDTCLYTNSLEIDNLEYIKIWDESESAGVFELDDNYMAEPVLTKFQDIRCIVGIPQRAQLTIRRLLITVIVLASISTLLGLSILLLNLWHNILNPLESLIKKQNSSSPGQNKIIHSLTNSFREMEQDRDLLQKERDYLMPLALGRYLTRLREASNPGEASAIADLCLNLTNLSEYSSIAVFAVCCVVDKNQYLDSTVSGNNVSITTLHFLLDNVLRDILFNQYPGTVAPLGKNSFAVIVGCEDANQELIEERATQLVEFFQQQIDTQIISTETYICSGASEFADAVKDIYQEITFLTFWEQNNGDDDNISEITGFYQRCHCIRKIISELTKDNADESFAQLDRLVRGIVNSNETDAEIAKYRLYALTTYIVTSIEEYLGGSENMGFAEKYEHSLFEAKTISEYNQQLQAFLLEALQAKESIDRTVFISNRMNEVKQYLKSHFRENSLNVASVAAQFGISVSYLSRSFKSAYNINILEYIQRLRVNEAKKMLLTDTVQNVAHEVGFWDAQALIRSFKKFEGINPGDYKRLSENEHNWN